MAPTTQIVFIQLRKTALHNLYFHLGQYSYTIATMKASVLLFATMAGIALSRPMQHEPRQSDSLPIIPGPGQGVDQSQTEDSNNRIGDSGSGGSNGTQFQKDPEGL